MICGLLVVVRLSKVVNQKSPRISGLLRSMLEAIVASLVFVICLTRVRVKSTDHGFTLKGATQSKMLEYDGLKVIHPTKRSN